MRYCRFTCVTERLTLFCVCRSRLARKYPSIRDAFRAYEHVPGGDDLLAKRHPAACTSDLGGDESIDLPVAGWGTRTYATATTATYGSLRSSKSSSSGAARSGLQAVDDRKPYATVRSIHEGLQR